MHLAQLNIGRLVDDPDSPKVTEFMDALPAINLLGEASPGFVWRLKDEEGPGAVGQRLPGYEDDERMIVNLTVWTDFRCAILRRVPVMPCIYDDDSSGSRGHRSRQRCFGGSMGDMCRTSMRPSSDWSGSAVRGRLLSPST